MKKLNKHKILSAACIAALPLLVVACLEFDGIIQPGRALTDSEIEVTAQLRVSRAKTARERSYSPYWPPRHGTSATMPRSI